MFIAKGRYTCMPSPISFSACISTFLDLLPIKRDKPGIRTTLLLISKMSLKQGEKRVFCVFFPYKFGSHCQKTKKYEERGRKVFCWRRYFLLSFCRDNVAEKMQSQLCPTRRRQRKLLLQNICKTFHSQHSLHAARVEEEQAPWGSRISNPGIFLGS